MRSVDRFNCIQNKIICLYTYYLIKSWFMIGARLDSCGCTREVAEHERSVRDEAIAACNYISLIPRWLSSSLVSSIAFTVKTFTAETQTLITLGAMLNRPATSF